MESGFICNWFSLQNLTLQLSAIEERNCRRDATSPYCDATVVDNNIRKICNVLVLLACEHADSIRRIDSRKCIAARLHTSRTKYCMRTVSQTGNPFRQMSNPAWIEFRFRASPASSNVRSVPDETIWKRTKRAPEVHYEFESFRVREVPCAPGTLLSLQPLAHLLRPVQ